MKYATLICSLMLLGVAGCCCCPGYAPPASPSGSGHASGDAPPPGGGVGIPYWPCTTDTVCTDENLVATQIDLKRELYSSHLCETSWCRAYYNANKVCLSGDKIVCGKGTNLKGTATCAKGGWGACI